MSSSMNPSAVERKYEKLFREYIGAQDKGVTFDHVASHYYDPNIDYFDLILAFAIDCDPTSKQPTEGRFSAFWDNHLTPAAVAAFKLECPKARVMLSIGGDTVQGDKQAPVLFTPATPDKVMDREYADRWIRNAVESLAALMKKYDLDGIDVNYEHFEKVSAQNVEKFVYCIKGLLIGLKNKKEFLKMVTSIAPYYDDNVQANYQALWNSCRNENLIDYVNFQFYSGDRQRFYDNAGLSYDEAVYSEQVGHYPGARVLASFTTLKDEDNPGHGLEAGMALTEARRLHEMNKLPGIFIWSVDSSFDADNSDPQPNNNRFRHEKKAIRILNLPPYPLPGQF